MGFERHRSKPSQREEREAARPSEMNVGEREEASRRLAISGVKTTTRTQKVSSEVQNLTSERIGVVEAGRGIGNAVNRDLGRYLDPLAAQVEQLDLDAKVGQRLDVVGRGARDDVAVGAEKREAVDPLGESRGRRSGELNERASVRVQGEGERRGGVGCRRWRRSAG